MSQYPWPEDVYAVARLDWCRSLDTPEGGAVAQLICNDMARQCGSFTNATKDRQRIARTAPQIQELLKPVEIEEWSGRCPKVRVEGVCNLGGARSYQKELWDAFAQPRENEAYDRINRLPGPRPALEELAEEQSQERLAEAVLPPPLDKERVQAMGALALNARPVRAVSAYEIRALPFL